MSGNASVHGVDRSNTLTNGKVKWVPLQLDTNGGIYVAGISGTNYPNTLYDYTVTANATNTDNLVIYTSNDVSMYNCTTIYVSAGSVSVQGSVDGTTYSGDLALINCESTTPATRVLTTTGTVTYRLDGKWRYIKVLQNGTGAAANIIISHSVM